MRLNLYLIFNGQCREAFEFYERCLSGKMMYMGTYADAPEGQGLPAALPGRIMHATLGFDGNVIMGSDAPQDHPQPDSSTHLAVETEGVDKAEALFAALSEGARITMPLCETFWAYRFGMLIDKFGVPWMISAGKPMDGAAG